MGNKVVTFSEEQIDDYQDCTYFTRKEILRVHKRFRELSPSTVPKCMTGDEAHTIKVPLNLMETLPEFRENPFRKRIFSVFSSDGTGNMTFEDFLELLSVLSEQAPRDIKVFYAFKIYDFDGDEHIGPADLQQALTLLTSNELNAEETSQACAKVVEESDIDGDGKLSFIEFEHVILRAPDFLTTFHIRI
ncbi:calcium and integrin-binding family member 2 isoform X2 [Cloeon dipterum]|uniref:calcium and integrin-binding family member 2 isoform X2 n=1 Tax=Cloeon dipterum TaxID=197152 RepID=UPI00321FE323